MFLFFFLRNRKLFEILSSEFNIRLEIPFFVSGVAYKKDLLPMEESGYPSILDTEEFWEEIDKSEEFSLYHDLLRRYFLGILTLKIYVFSIFLM